MTGRAPSKKTRGRQRVGPLQSASANSTNEISSLVVRIEPSRAATQACVVVAIPFQTNHWVFEALRAGTGSALHDVRLLDQSITAYAAYEAITDKLSGSTVDAIKNKVVDSRCGAQGGEFLISVTCAPTLASARKCAGIILQQLRWNILYQRYVNWCKVLGVNPDKSAHTHAAHMANNATRGKVTVVITGKVQADSAGAERTAELLSRKVKDSAPKERGHARTATMSDIEGVGEPLDSLYASRPAPGLYGVIAHNFVESNVRGEASHLVSGVLMVPNAKVAQAKRLAHSQKAEKYASSLLRLKDEALGALVFIAAKGCYVETSSLTVTPPTGLTETTALSAIKKAFE